MSQFEVRSGMKLAGISKEGVISAGAGAHCVRGRAGPWKEKGGAMQVRRVMMGRAARAKVWEESIEEEEVEEVIDRRLREEAMGERGSSGCKAKANEEIGVFDAERYFGGGPEQQAGWVREEEEELMEGEAGGDLPLSPLVEFGKGKSWRDGRGTAREARGWVAASFAQRRPESSEFTSPRTSTASSLSEVEPPLQQRRAPISQPAGNKSKSKLQPASPSSRLASFLAKFKPPTPRKSPASSPILHLMSSSTPPPPPRPTPPSVLSPAKKLLPNSLLATPHGKAPSPRGRFLRAFSSSSADHTSSTSLRHHTTVVAAPSSMAASSPVSPAAHSAPPDPYSPITYSASITPTTARVPNRSPHSSSLPLQPYSSSSSKISSTTASGRTSPGSFKQQLPFLSRKLKVYLMPDKAGADQLSKKEISAKTQFNKAKTGSTTGQPGDLLYIRKHAPEEKQRRRWLHAEDQVVDEDIELAERLLRVVQDHQSSSNHYAGKSSQLLTANHAAISKGATANYQHKSSYNVQGFADRVSEYSSRKYDQMHPAATTASNLTITPHARSAYMHTAVGGAAPALGRQNLTSMNSLQPPIKEEPSLYDSDSSSDLFEIETLASVGMGLYRRDLPVYEAKEHVHSNHGYTFVSSRPR